MKNQNKKKLWPSWSLLEPPGASWSLLELLEPPGASWSFLEPPGASWSLPEPAMASCRNFLMDDNCRRLLRPNVLKGSAEKAAACKLCVKLTVASSKLQNQWFKLSPHLVQTWSRVSPGTILIYRLPPFPPTP